MNTNVPDSDLSRHLTRQADQFDRLGGSPLDLGQVLDRAGEIKRGRRMRATMVMAAVVLAVAVPTAIVAAGGPDAAKPVTPAHPAKADSSPLSLDGLTQGRAPLTGYVQGDVWHADGTSTDLATSGQVLAVVPLGSRFLVETTTIEGPLRAAIVPAPPAFVGQETSWPVEGGLVGAGRNDGVLAAFVQPDGTPVVVQDDGRVSTELPRIPRGSGFDVVALTGSDCKESGSDTCEVLVTTHGRKVESWVSSSTGHVAEYEQLSNVVDLFEGKLVAGYTEITDTGSCSVVESLENLDQGSAWRTCDHSLGSFSPDGKHLSAFPAYLDGAGSSSLAVLDAATGDVVIDLQTMQDAFVTHVAWEDDEHLLAVVGEGTQAAILRIGLDGSREYAVPPTATEPYETPFVLPSV